MNDTNTQWLDEQLADQSVLILDYIQSLEDALQLPLLFHRGEWTNIQRTEWASITDSGEATTKVMCDHIRKVMDRQEPSTSPTERDANARLTAAAPDLLAALEGIQGRLNPGPDQWRAVHEAIAKAKGQS